MTPMARIKKSRGMSQQSSHSDNILPSLSVSSVGSVVHTHLVSTTRRSGGWDRLVPSSLRTQASKLKRSSRLDEGPHDWSFSAVFPIVRGRRWGGAIEKRSTRLRTDGHQFGIAGKSGFGVRSAEFLIARRSRGCLVCRATPLPPLAKWSVS